MLRQADAPNTPKSEKKKRDEVAQKFYCEISQPITKNIHFYYEEVKALEAKKQENYQIHKMLFGKLYSKNVFLHYNQTQGMVHMYRVSADSVERSLSVLVLDPLISYEMQVADNLILISNKSNSLFSIYDTKSMYKLKQPLFQNGKVDLSYSAQYFCDNFEDSDAEQVKKTKNESYLIMEPLISIEDLAEDEETTMDSYSNSYVEMKFNLINDQIDIQPDLLPPDTNPKSKPPEFSLKDYIAIDLNLTYNLKERKFFIYIFNKKAYFRKVSKKVPGLINLMRRGNPKGVILNNIRQLI